VDTAARRLLQSPESIPGERSLIPFTPRSFVLLCLLLPAIGCAGGSPLPDRPSVLLLTLDTTRADHLGCYGRDEAQTPVLDDLAAGGVRFTNAVAHAPLTLPSHASILTGLYPVRHGARSNGFYRLREDRETLAETLREEGYATGAVVAAFVLDRRFGLDQGFEHYDDDPEAMSKASQFEDASRPASDVTDAALAVADRLDPSRPYFLWVHYFDPHFPYLPPPDVAAAFPSTRAGRYDGEIAHMDHEIGRLLDGLRRRGRMRRTVVVVIGDHGEGFPGPHDEQSHGFYVYRDTIRVPFLVHAPGSVAQGIVSDRLARQVDVAPTILDLVGVEPASAGDGTSLAPILRQGSVEPAQDGETLSFAEAVAPWFAYGWAALYAVETDDWKYIEAPRPELYDLRADPLELSNLAESHPDRTRAMRELLERILAGEASAGARDMTDRERARLQALGYVAPAGEVHDPRKGNANRRLPDPKEMLDVHLALKEVDSGFLQGGASQAIERLQRLRERDPDNYQVHERLCQYHEAAGNLDSAMSAARTLIRLKPGLALGYDRLADLEERRAQERLEAGDRDGAEQLASRAVEHWKKAIDLGILEYNPMLKVAIHHLRRGDHDAAIELLERARRIDDRSFDIERFLGMAHQGAGRLDDARRHLESAVDLAGEHPDMQAAARGPLAGVYRKLGMRAEAIEQIEWILERQPDHPARAALEATVRELRR